MSLICIIPARGGSKRLPGKNIRDFLGKPIIAYSIESALETGVFDEVMVSTDDEEISSIAKKYHAKVPFLRSEKTSNDHAGLSDVIIEVLKQYEEIEKFYDMVCCVLPTAPFITSKKLMYAKRIIDKGIYDSVFPIVEYSYPIQRSLKITNDYVAMRWPENLNERSQDLEPSYHDAGQFYFIKTRVLLSEKKLFTSNAGYIELNSLEVQDIDTEIDWKLAEMKYKLMNDET